jgi:hypothetical protein
MSAKSFLRSRQLGMDGKAGNHRRCAFFLGLPAEGLVVLKLLPVPGVGRAGYVHAPAAFFGVAEIPEKIEGMAMGIGKHTTTLFSLKDLVRNLNRQGAEGAPKKKKCNSLWYNKLS